MNRIVRVPYCRAFFSVSMTCLISLIPESAAENSMNSALVMWAMIWARVVLPTPGGPQKMIDPGSSRSICRRRGFPGARMCSCPTNSSSVRGLIRRARGEGGGGVWNKLMEESGHREIGKSEHRKTGKPEHRNIRSSDHLIFRPSFIFYLSCWKVRVREFIEADLRLRFPDVPISRCSDVQISRCLSLSRRLIQHNRSGDSGVQRFDAGRMRNGHQFIGLRQHIGGDPPPFVAHEQRRRPRRLRPLALPALLR